VGNRVEMDNGNVMDTSEPTEPIDSYKPIESPNPSHFYRKPKSVSSFIAGFKSVVNSKIDDYIDENHLHLPKFNRDNHFFQPNYYDHIIRDLGEYERIKNYIARNPSNWKDDKFWTGKK
jgi:putative transposase